MAEPPRPLPRQPEDRLSWKVVATCPTGHRTAKAGQREAADEEEHSLKENLVNASDKTESIENSSDLPVVILFGMEDSEVHAC